jgi:uncharacterized membrane-anchored protein YhcB (DUF1043 family)
MGSEPAKIPFFGARRAARALAAELSAASSELDARRAELREAQSTGASLRKQLADSGALSVYELSEQESKLRASLGELERQATRIKSEADQRVRDAEATLAAARSALVQTEELAMLQDVGVYKYRHPLTDAVSYQTSLSRIEERTKAMIRKDGGAILAATAWNVNGSAAQGRAMIRDLSKLMLRAFNAEADNLVRGLKPYKLDAAIERLTKVAEAIAKLGQIMQVRIAKDYLSLRIQELELTADFLHKVAEEKEVERLEREKLREERKAQQEMERERAKLEKERKHYSNALEALMADGNAEAAARLREQLADVDRAIADVDYRAANIRAGYVYVISNIGSFGEQMIKIGMTRRLDPLDRIRELSDASVPFNFDVHALFFSKDAVGIETSMHQRFAARRVNMVNNRREFFRATASEAKVELSALAGELLEFNDVPEALEYRESVAKLEVPAVRGPEPAAESSISAP